MTASTPSTSTRIPTSCAAFRFTEPAALHLDPGRSQPLPPRVASADSVYSITRDVGFLFFVLASSPRSSSRDDQARLWLPDPVCFGSLLAGADRDFGPKLDPTCWRG